jgi:diguanylate cyclase (GGDEF)-like protein
MNLDQIVILGFEAAVMIAVILALFRARTTLGLTPLYIVIGGFQYLEATLDLHARITPGFAVMPASVVMFTTTLITTLLIYLKEDAVEARKLVYGLVLANVAASLVSLLVGWHLTLPGSETQSGISSAYMLRSARVSMAGTSLLFLDVLGIILMYEFISKFVKGLLSRLFLSMLVTVAFDQTFFTLMLQAGEPNLVRNLLSGFAGKAVASAFYSLAAWVYLRWGDPQAATAGTGDVADVFQRLTYRQRYEAARQRMVRDGLTGLYNRGYFDEVLPQSLDHARRRGEPLSLIIIDTDNFKSINDQLSHMEGDAALRLIADVLLSEVRPSDTPCRYGGDEFVVLLSGADAPAAASFAERFRTALVDRCRTASPPFPWGYITTTIGIGTYPDDGESLDPAGLVGAADRRLYLGKHAGRDTVVAPGQPIRATL